MEITVKGLKLLDYWQRLTFEIKIIIIIYFIIFGIGSPGILSIFVPTTYNKSQNSFSTNGLFSINNAICQGEISTITACFIGFYWFTIFSLMVVNFIGFSEIGKLQLCIFTVVVDLLANFITFYLLKAIACQISNFLIFLCITTACSTTLFTTIHHKVFIGLVPNPKNRLSHRYDSTIFLTRILQNLAFGIHLSIILFVQQSQWQSHLYYVFLILLYTIRLSSLTKKRYFLDKLADFLFVFVTIICLVLLIITQVESVFQTNLISHGYLIIVTVIAFFGMFAYYQHNSHKFHDILLGEINEVINSGQETLYLDAIKQLYEHKNLKQQQFLVLAFCESHYLKSQKQKINFKISNLKYQSQYQNQSQYKKNQHGNQSFYQFQYSVKKALNHILLHTNNNEVIQQCLFLKLILFKQIFIVNRYLQQNSFSKQKTLFFRLSTSLIQSQIETIIESQNRKQLIKIDIDPIINLQIRLKTIRQIIIKDLSLKSQKWKHLCNNVCKSRQIQENVTLEVQNLINFQQIYQKHQQNYKKSSQFQSLAIFYYGSIIFCNKKCKEININMKNIFASLTKIKFITNDQNLISSIYSPKYCFLQLEIAQCLEQKINLTIKSFCKNALKILKCKDNKKLIGNNLMKYFPNFMKQNLFKKVCNQIKENKGKVTEIYLVNWQGHVFEALVSFRVVFIKQNISCVMLIEEKQRDNLILLDSQGFIENIGLEYVRLFTSYNYYRLHLSALLQSPSEFKSLQFGSCQVEDIKIKILNFVDVSELKQWWIHQLDCIGKWTISRQLMNSKNIQNIQNRQEQLKKHKKLFDLNDFYKFIETSRRNYSGKGQKIYNQNQNEEQSSRQTDQISNSLKIEIFYRKCCIEEKDFYVIKFLKVQINDQKRTNFLGQNHLKQNNVQISKDHKSQNNFTKLKKKNLKNKKASTNKYAMNQNYNNQFSRMNQSFEEREIEENDFFGEQSTKNSYSQALSIKKPLITFSEYLLDCPQSLSDRRLKRFRFISFTCCFLVLMIILAAYLFLTSYILEQRQLLQIDCAVSDSFQLAELLYSSAITYHIFQSNSQSVVNSLGQNQNLTLQYLSDIKRSFSQQKQLLLDLITTHQADFNKKHTAVSNRHYYDYIHTQAKWKGLAQSKYVGDKVTNWVQIEGQSINIVTGQLLMLYHTHSNAVININPETQSNNTKQYINQEILKSLGLMKENFPQLKRLNHYNIFHYSKLVQQAYTNINLFIYVFAGIHAVLALKVLVITYLDSKFRTNQKHSMVQLYTTLNYQTPQKVYQYFTNILSEFVQIQNTNVSNTSDINYHHNSNIYKPYNSITPNSIIQQDPNQNNPYSNDNTRKKKSQSPTNFVINPSKNLILFKLLIFVLVTNFLFIFGMYKITILNSTIDQVVLGIGLLMDAQNYLLESYFDLKANFIEPNPRYDNQFFTSLLENQSQVDVIFNKIALNTLQIFAKYDPQYSDDFVDLLRSNVCQVIKEVLNEIQYQQCIDSNQMQYFDDGIAVTMNFITRKIYQTILQVQKRANTYANNKSQKYQIYDIIRQYQHREINQNIFYVFRMFQLLQKKINTELQNITQITLKQCQIFIILEVFLILLIYPIWVIFNYKKQKKQITKLYLSVLFFNQQLIGQSTKINQKAAKVLEFSHQTS